MLKKMKPVLFSTPMVQGILENRKTMTRRVINPQPPQGWFLMDDAACIIASGYQWTEHDYDDDMMGWFPSYESGLRPKYQVGDILWVKETFMINDPGGDFANSTRHARCHYKAGGEYKTIKIGDDKQVQSRWRSPRYMPKAAARIFLRVTSVKPERLWDITDDDAVREGIFRTERHGWFYTDPEKTNHPNCTTAHKPKQAFMWLWQKLNDMRDGGKYACSANPWVWAYGFERITKEEAEREAA